LQRFILEVSKEYWSLNLCV